MGSEMCIRDRVLRDQEDADGDEVEAQVYDIYLNYTIPAKARLPQITLSFEGAYLEGFTDRVIHENAQEGIDLEGIGAVARVDLGYKDLGLNLRLEAGYASGDANFYDDKNFSFTFDPDYNVGLVLFDEVIAGISAVAPETIADPSRIYLPQKGIDILPTDGSLTNVIYQMVGFSYSPAPLKGLGVKGAVIYAQADQYFSDPYQTYKAGGVAHNFLGAKCDSRELGWELDFGLSYTFHLPNQLSLKLGGEYGRFFPAGAFKDQEGERMDPVEKIRALFSLNW